MRLCCSGHVPNDSIKHQLVRNRLYDNTCNTRSCPVCPHGRIGDCTKAGVVYQIECMACHVMYIGETGRPLGVRINEHLSGKRRLSIITPLGKHRRDDHEDNDFDIKCTILAFESSTPARKALEACFIISRNPRMNGRNEHLSITSDFLPYLP